MRNKFTARLLIALLLLSTLIVSAALPAGAAEENSCGPSATYTLENGVLTIRGSGAVEKDAFYANRNIKKLIVEPGITVIGETAFSDCQSLEEVILPDTLTEIETRAFERCFSLKSFTIPASVRKIGYQALSYCREVEELRFLGDCPDMGESVLWGTAANIYVPDHWKEEEMLSYGNRPQNYIGGFRKAGEGVVFSQRKLNSFLIRGSGVIADGLFKDRSDVHELVVEEGVTGIGKDAFSGCTNLSSLTLPSTLRSIGESAFLRTAIKSLELPGAVQEIGEYAFQSCPALASAVLKEGITYVSRGMFEKCTALTSVTLPAGLKTIGGYAFYGCDRLVTLTIPDTVKTLEGTAFYRMASLSSIDIPASVETIGDSCFYEDAALKKVIFHEGLVSIGDKAFCGCSLTDLRLPETLKQIGEDSFASLSAVKTLAIPSGITRIPAGCFQQMTSLTSVTLPEDLIAIDGAAFYHCTSLTSITIPAGVQTIGKRAFYDCSGLNTITFLPEEVPGFGMEAFRDCGALATVYAPFESTGDYARETALGNVRILGMFAGETLPEQDGVYRIGSAGDFAVFLHTIAEGNTYQGKSVVLTADIDLSSVLPMAVWPDEKCESAFSGSFDGQDHTISCIVIRSSGHRIGLFRTVHGGAVIKNLKLRGVSVTSEGKGNGCAALIGFTNGTVTVKNVSVLDGTVSGYRYAAGIVGDAGGNKALVISDCFNAADITSFDNDAAGILAHFIGSGTVSIENCSNSGSVSGAAGHAGGIAGYLGDPDDDPTHRLTDCENTGTVVCGGNAGGIVGGLQTDSRSHTVSGCYNLNDVKATGKESYAGGIVGYMKGGGTFSNNDNRGDVTCSGREAGGIVAAVEDDPCVFDSNRNAGRIRAQLGVGGIAGYVGDKDLDPAYRFDFCVNEGEIISETSDAGGIVGRLCSDSLKHSLTNCECFGNVNGAKCAGGIVGWMAGGGSFIDCECDGNVTADPESGYAGGIVGKIEDDACSFRNIYVDGEVSGKHSAYCCAWDGKNKGSIGSDLVASSFFSGNLWIIAGGTVLLVAALLTVAGMKKKKA